MRIGIDIGGSKIAAERLAADGSCRAARRAATPADYAEMLEVVAAMVDGLDGIDAGVPPASVGVGVPGLVRADGDDVWAVNLPCLQGRPFRSDLAQRLGRSVAVANDAHCFALSEATDGAAAGASSVFGAVIGTGVGGGLVVGGRLVSGVSGACGEWGHLPLPWRTAADGPAHRCGCGRDGCLDAEISGRGLAARYAAATGRTADATTIAARAAAGDRDAAAVVATFHDAVGRALALVVRLIDPAVIVLGGTVGRMPGLIAEMPRLAERHGLGGPWPARVVAARHGADSGVRGAAWLGGVPR